LQNFYFICNLTLDNDSGHHHHVQISEITVQQKKISTKYHAHHALLGKATKVAK